MDKLVVAVSAAPKGGAGEPRRRRRRKDAPSLGQGASMTHSNAMATVFARLNLDPILSANNGQIPRRKNSCVVVHRRPMALLTSLAWCRQVVTYPALALPQAHFNVLESVQSQTRWKCQTEHPAVE